MNSIFHTSQCGSTLLGALLSKSLPTKNEPEWSHKIAEQTNQLDFIKQNASDNEIIKYPSVYCYLMPQIEGKKVFIYRYWCKIVEYNGEKKPRYLYQDKLSELRRLYEDIFEKYKLEEQYVTFIETEGLRIKEGIGSSGKKVSGSNICEFVGIILKKKIVKIK
jgi:hypothetical protein